MVSDSSDILGQQTMPILKGNRPSRFPFSVFQSLVIFVVLVVIYVVGNRLRKSILLWREESYKLATRRRHGIPDSDLRPFNVAYSEAMVRARDEEKRRQAPPSKTWSQPTLRQREGRSEDHQNSQNPYRSEAMSRSTAVPFPGAYYTPDTNTQHQLERSTVNLASNNAHYRQAAAYPLTNGVPRPLSRQSAYSSVPAGWTVHDERKRVLDENEDEQEQKRSRVEGEDMIDGHEEAVYEEQPSSRHRRGFKRAMQEQDEEDDSEEAIVNKKTRGKRARKVSAVKYYSTDQDMDIDDEEADEVTELRTDHRGKKRDRAEAGSTFGGDDDESDAEVDNSKARRRHRKRRTVAKRKSEVAFTRGKKREREGDFDNSDIGSDGDSSPEKSSSRKRRGRRSAYNDDLTRSDISMDDSTVSTRSRIRNIGDEWESNGVKYKIGVNGQRLRQALVKKARHKFVMPKDSQHPDRDANLQVCVECWLTEEEYRDAKSQRMLAWQDSPKKADDAEKLTVDVSQDKVRLPHGTSGKNLLWSTSTSTTPTLSPSSYSPAALPISPFLNTQVPTVKRISSASRAISLNSSYGAKLADSTNGPLHTTHKTFSKWEKQELEAQAMMKIRELNRKKDLEMNAEKEKAEKQERELKAKLEEANKKALTVPTISIVPPEPSKPASAPATSTLNLFGTPAAPTGTGTASGTATTQSAPSISNLFGKPAQPSSNVSIGAANTGFSLTPTPAAANSTPAAEATKLSFGFNGSMPTPGAPKASSFSFAPAAAATSTTTEPAKSVFSFPTAPATTGATPASTTTEPVKTAFSFPTTSTTSGAASKPMFAFPSSTSATSNDSASQTKPAESLFSRISSQPAKVEGNSTSTTAPTSVPPPMFAFSKPADNAAVVTSTANSTEAGSGLKFSFNQPKPAAPSGSTSFFGTAATNGATPAADSTTTATGTSNAEGKKPMFSFNTTPTVPSTTSSSLFGAIGASASNPTSTAPKFSFTGSAFGATQPTSNGESTKPAFGNGASAPASSGFGSFGGAGSTSAFGAQANGEKKDAPKSAFGTSTFGTPGSLFGGSNGTSSGAFGGAANNTSTTASTVSAFPPVTNGTSAFGSSSNMFGSKPAAASTSIEANPFGSANAESKKAEDAPKSMFSFAPNTTTTTTNGTSTPSKPFSFASTTTPATAPTNGATTTPAGTPASGGFSFKFGQTTTAAPAAASSPFGTTTFRQPSASGGVATSFSFGQQK